MRSKLLKRINFLNQIYSAVERNFERFLWIDKKLFWVKKLVFILKALCICNTFFRPKNYQNKTSRKKSSPAYFNYDTSQLNHNVENEQNVMEIIVSCYEFNKSISETKFEQFMTTNYRYSVCWHINIAVSQIKYLLLINSLMSEPIMLKTKNDKSKSLSPLKITHEIGLKFVS